MIGYAHCGTGTGLAGCIVPQMDEPRAMDGLEYVMVDPGTPFPHAAATQALGADETPTISDEDLWRRLYARNKLAFWIGGSVVGLLALNGLFHVIKR